MNVLATLLDLNGLLPKFISDFSDAYFATADTFRAAEARRLAANLRPIVDIFGAGPALLDIPFAKAP